MDKLKPSFTVTPAEAARLWHQGIDAVYKVIRVGGVKVRKRDGRWLLEEADVARLAKLRAARRARRPRGRQLSPHRNRRRSQQNPLLIRIRN